MKKIYLTTLFLPSLLCYSTAQLYTQYFDGTDTVFSKSINVELDTGNTNIWQIGTPQKAIFNGAATVPNVIVTDTIGDYPVNNTSRFTIKISGEFVSWGVLAIQWKQKLDMDINYDGGIVEFTTDHGLTWENAFNNPYVYNFYGFQPSNLDTLHTGEFAFSGTDSTWRDIWLCFDLSWIYQYPDTLMFRFTFTSDSVDNEREGWMMDNFMAHLTYIHTVKDVNKTGYLNVYPNPSGHIVHVEAERLLEFHIIEHMELINTQGVVVERWTNIPTKFWFDVSKYSDGIYFLHVKTNIQSKTVPIIVSKH